VRFTCCVHVHAETRLLCSCARRDSPTVFMCTERLTYCVHVHGETHLLCSCARRDSHVVFMCTERLTCCVHVHGEALLQSAVGAPVAPCFVNHTVSLPGCEQQNSKCTVLKSYTEWNLYILT